MKLKLPTMMKKALLSAMCVAAVSLCNSVAEATTVTLTENTAYTYGSSNWATGQAYKTDGKYQYSSESEKAHSLSFSGGVQGVFRNTQDEGTDFKYLNYTKLRELLFSGNKAGDIGDGGDGGNGGAIDSESGQIAMEDNGHVSFKDNEAKQHGGGIYAFMGKVYMGGNRTEDGTGGVTFTGNKAGTDGGAIGGFADVEITDNGQVIFENNSATTGEGGAIYSGRSTTITKNDKVIFTGNTIGEEGNTTAGYGGSAIYSQCGHITLSDNKEVSFRGNKSYGNRGGAIYAQNGNVDIVNNGKTLFEKNLQRFGNISRLCSIYVAAGKLTMAAPEEGEIRVKDSIIALSDVRLNAYTDANGNELTSTGTIIFDGESVAKDLESILGSTPTDEQILLSKTSKIVGTTTLHGGNLQVINGARLTDKGGLVLAEGSNATLLMRHSTIEKHITVHSGSTLALEGFNSAGSLTLSPDATISFTLTNEHKTTPVLTLTDDEAAIKTDVGTVRITPPMGLDEVTTFQLIKAADNGEYGWVEGQQNLTSMYWKDGIFYYVYTPINVRLTQLEPKAHSHNGQAGLTLLKGVPVGSYAPGGDLAKIFQSAEHQQLTDHSLAAVAGASTAVLGKAFNNDVERQLRAIRNRNASGEPSYVYTADGKYGMGYQPGRFYAWANVEGNRHEIEADGTAAGYTLDNWGWTVGAGMQMNHQLTVGVALTAMYGDIKTSGPDRLNGEMDTAYLSAFADFTHGTLNHAFIATIGVADIDYGRNVAHANGIYSTRGDTNGRAIGLMYELSRDYALANRGIISPLFNFSYRHSHVDCFSETGSDAGLHVNKQSADTATLGLGARYSASQGMYIMNRTCAFDARALAKYEFGDSRNHTSVGLLDHATRADIESAKVGAFGVELGAGLSTPLGNGSVFADGSIELRNDYTNVNATMGYRIRF